MCLFNISVKVSTQRIKKKATVSATAQPKVKFTNFPVGRRSPTPNLISHNMLGVRSLQLDLHVANNSVKLTSIFFKLPLQKVVVSEECQLNINS